jgi:GT2 family glycosyltransferase
MSLHGAAHVSPFGRRVPWIFRRIGVELARRAARRAQWQRAEACYRRVLSLRSADARLWVQFGHALKAQRRYDEAARAYLIALQCDPESAAALQEAVALGELERAYDVLARHGRSAPDWLPVMASGASGQSERFAALCASHRSARPRTAVRSLVLVIGGDAAAADATAQALAGQVGAEWSIERVTAERVGARLREADAEQALLVAGGVCPEPAALCWFAHAFAVTDAALAIADQLVRRPDGTAEAWFKCVPDADMLAAGQRFGNLLAVRLPAAPELLDGGDGAGDPIHALLAAATGRLPVAHLPLLLATGPAPSSPAPRVCLPSRAGAAAAPNLSVIIPTRDGVRHLERCIASLDHTAADLSRIEVVIVDNGSRDEATLRFLREGAAAGRFAVVREDCPFNWSHLNNCGLAASRGEVVLFLNDDITFRSAGWDAELLDVLTDDGIGAVGARLLYPDGRVQHGGIVLRPGTHPEHDGRGAPGDAPGPMERWVTRRAAAAVTGAFLASRRAHVAAVGGFDTALPVWFNDVDFCLRQRRQGRRILYLPSIEAIHHESFSIDRVFRTDERRRDWEASLAAMKARWGDWLERDPSHNPNYASHGPAFAYVRALSEPLVHQHLLLSASATPWRIPDMAGASP